MSHGGRDRARSHPPPGRQAGGIDTPLTRRIAHFSKIISIVIVALAAFTFAIGVARGEPAAEMFIAAVALAVGAIPEGLPAAVTITLAIGVAVWPAAARSSASCPPSRRSAAPPSSARDKTGTLTENQMTVQWISAGGDSCSVDGRRVRAARCDPARRGCHDAGESARPGRVPHGRRPLQRRPPARARAGDTSVVGDPTEAALQVVARKGGLDPVALARGRPRIDAIPFESERQYMATLHSGAPGQAPVVYAQGRPRAGAGPLRAGARADRRRRSPWTRRPCSPRSDGSPARACGCSPSRAPRCRPGTVTLERGVVDQGGLTLARPRRRCSTRPGPTAIAAVASCRAAGIAVKMITGDHVATAAAIAGRSAPGRRPGGRTPEVLTGAAARRALDDEALRRGRGAGERLRAGRPRAEAAPGRGAAGPRARRGHDRRRRQRRPGAQAGRHRRGDGRRAAPRSPRRPRTWCSPTTTSPRSRRPSRRVAASSTT